MNVEFTEEGIVMCDGIVCSNFAYPYLRCDGCPFTKVLRVCYKAEGRELWHLLLSTEKAVHASIMKVAGIIGSVSVESHTNTNVMTDGNLIR